MADGIIKSLIGRRVGVSQDTALVLKFSDATNQTLKAVYIELDPCSSVLQINIVGVSSLLRINVLQIFRNLRITKKRERRLKAKRSKFSKLTFVVLY